MTWTSTISRCAALIGLMLALVCVTRLEAARLTVQHQHWSEQTVQQDGARIAEQATFDRFDKLVHAEIRLTCPSGYAELVVLDPHAGVIDVTTPTGSHRWYAPTDLPWMWAPRACLESVSRRVATPLAARVTLHGAKGTEALRLLDLNASDRARRR
jgi:hypothetical protein